MNKLHEHFHKKLHIIYDLTKMWYKGCIIVFIVIIIFIGGGVQWEIKKLGFRKMWQRFSASSPKLLLFLAQEMIEILNSQLCVFTLENSQWIWFKFKPSAKMCAWLKAAFRLACGSPHCRFDGDICSTAQAPLAAEGRPSRKQRHANQSITPPLCPKRQTIDRWLLFNFRLMPLGEEVKVAWPLIAVTLKRQAVITKHSNKVASGKQAWNQHTGCHYFLQQPIQFKLALVQRTVSWWTWLASPSNTY